VTLPSWWPLVAIPLINGGIGWMTNALAIRMLFAPLERIGVGPVGWQGVIPAHAARMAGICVDLMTRSLLDVEAVFARIQPWKVAEQVGPTLERRAERIAEQVIATRYPKLWETVPRRVRDATLARLKSEIPRAVEQVMSGVQEDITRYLDLKALIVHAFVHNKALLIDLFQRCGGREFRFISRSGLGFGLLFGGIQALVWRFFSPWWLLPVGGLFVGWATNWLALKMVFRPLEPRGVGPLRWQGLFLKRQDEVSAEYAAFFAREILTAERLVDAILRGPASDELFALIHRAVTAAIDDAAGRARPVVQLAMGTEDWVHMKRQVCDRLVAEVPRAVARAHGYADEALDLDNELRQNLQALPPAEFEQVLRPIFQEDETLLIAIGAALGLGAGCLQLFLFG